MIYASLISVGSIISVALSRFPVDHCGYGGEPEADFKMSLVLLCLAWVKVHSVL